MNRRFTILIIISSFLLFLRFLFILKTMTVGDEAYYYMYSKHLAWGYIDHGPVVAAIIKFGSVIFGENGFGIRFGGLLLYIIISLYLFHFGKNEFNRNTGIILSVSYWTNILFHTNGIVTTPDAPLAFFSLLSICMYYNAFFKHQKYYIPAGIFLGLAFLSKISVLFIAIGIFLFPIINTHHRSNLKNYRFYLSFVISFLIFFPFIFWNIQNDWAFVKYQGSHIAKAGDFGSFIELWIGLAILLGPVMFYYTITQSVKNIFPGFLNNNNSSSRLQYLSLVTIIPLLYFVTHSLFSRFELNWPAPVFYGGIILFSVYIGKDVERYKKRILFQWGLSLGLILTITAQTFYPILPVKGKNDITNRYFIYSGLLNDLDMFLNNNPKFKNYRITANNYQIPSMINLYIRPLKESICLSVGYHKTLYSFLYPMNLIKKERVLFVNKGINKPIFLSSQWNQIKFLSNFQSERGGVSIQKYSLWELTEDLKIEEM